MKEGRITVILKVTSDCNLRCPYCYLSDSLNTHKEMDMETFETSLMKLCLNYKEVYLIFHGGEPTLIGYEKLEKMLEKGRLIASTLSSKLIYAMQTNLTLVDEKMIKLFLKHKVGLGFSYDGYFNEQTRGNDEKIINNHRKCKELGLNCGCISLLMSENTKDSKNHELFMQALGIDYRFNHCFETKEGNKLKFDYESIKETKDFIDFLFEQEETRGLGTFRNEIDFAITGKSYSCETINCAGKWMSINPGGEISPCGQTWDWRKEKYVFGNIKDLDISKYMYEDVYSNFVNKINNLHSSVCENCEIFDFCKGGCPAKNYNNNGDVDVIDENFCNYKKEILFYIKNKIDSKDFKNLEIIKKIKEKGGVL